LEDLNDCLNADEDTDENTGDVAVLMEANARLFEILWPLAQEAQSIIDHRWSSVEKLGSELLKTGSLGRADIEAIIGAGFCEEPSMTEQQQPGTVAFQPQYVTLLGGDLQCALMLSQLVSWLIRGTGQDSPPRVFKDGNWWIAVSWQEWQHDLGFSRAKTRRCLKTLQKAGLIEVAVYKLNGNPVCHVRFPWAAFGKTLPGPPTAAELQHRIALTKRPACSADTN
jgi:hypothetical protein